MASPTQSSHSKPAFSPVVFPSHSPPPPPASRASASSPRISPPTQSGPARAPLLKICGVASPRDAELVLTIAVHRLSLPPASLRLGMILWPRSPRSVSGAVATVIAHAAREAGVQPVGVFVDETAEQMMEVSRDVGVGVVQLHGDAARRAEDELDPALGRIRVVDVRPDGSLCEDKDGQLREYERTGAEDGPMRWRLFDAKGGGTGTPFDWGRFADEVQGQQRWLLAGGLSPENVASAVSRLAPPGLDVASGVSGPDRVAKDPDRVKAFLYEAMNAYQRL